MTANINELIQRSYLVRNAWYFITERFSIDQPSIELVHLLSSLNFDEETLATALIYENKIFPENKEDFAPYLHNTVLQLLIKLKNLDKLTVINQQIINSYQNIDNLRKMFLVMATDTRLIILKIAEHLIKMRRIDLNNELSSQLAKEAEIIYNPLANRLGITQLKWELENLTFKFSKPIEYQNLKRQINSYFPNSEKRIQEIIKHLERLLNSISDIKITGRVKHLHSIYRKMIRKNTNFNGIFDIIAIRILVKSVTECYQVLSIIHDNWKYIPEELDDYIATPKPNGYQSIHTAIIYEPILQQIVEIQIRTQEMHQFAELGIAAHWIYKENSKMDTYQLKLNWLHELMAWQKNLDIKLTSIFNDFIYVLTPKGDIIEMPFLSTPLDFAYYIHESVGHHCIGAKINDNISPLNQLLKNGDKIEIITSLRSNPKRDWLISNLGYIRTSRAKNKITHWFKKESLKNYRITGEQLYNKLIKKIKKPVEPTIWLNKFKFSSIQNLWENLGSGQLKIQQLEDILSSEKRLSTKKIPKANKTNNKKNTFIKIKGNINNLLINHAKCCNPSFNEPIIGYITKLKGITIHRSNCKNFKKMANLYPQKIIEVTWQNESIAIKDFNP